MKPSHTTTAQKLTRARVHLILSQPFFGTLSLRLKLIPGDLPTMATDGSRIVYNPAFVDRTQTGGTRRDARPRGFALRVGAPVPPRANVIQNSGMKPPTWPINPILIGNGFTLPAGALIDPGFNNLSAEEIYARLLRRRSEGNGAPKPQQQQTNAGGGMATDPQGTDGTVPSSPNPDPSHQPVSGQRGRATGEALGPRPMRPGGFGEVWDATDENGQTASPAEKRRQEHEWGIAAEQAVRSAKAWGHEPAGIERPLSESRQSKQDWRAILRDFVAATTPCDYRWTPPKSPLHRFGPVFALS